MEKKIRECQGSTHTHHITAEHAASNHTPGEVSRVNAGSTRTGSSERLPACGNLLTAISRGGVRTPRVRTCSAPHSLTSEACRLPYTGRWGSVPADLGPGTPSRACLPRRSLPLACAQDETHPGTPQRPQAALHTAYAYASGVQAASLGHCAALGRPVDGKDLVRVFIDHQSANDTKFRGVQKLHR